MELGWLRSTKERRKNGDREEAKLYTIKEEIMEIDGKKAKNEEERRLKRRNECRHWWMHT